MIKFYSLVVAFCLIMTLPGMAQRPRPAATSLPPADTVYFDRDWDRTETLEEVAYARVARRTPEGKTIGTVRDYSYPLYDCIAFRREAARKGNGVTHYP